MPEFISLSDTYSKMIKDDTRSNNGNPIVFPTENINKIQILSENTQNQNENFDVEHYKTKIKELRDVLVEYHESSDLLEPLTEELINRGKDVLESTKDLGG